VRSRETGDGLRAVLLEVYIMDGLLEIVGMKGEKKILKNLPVEGFGLEMGGSKFKLL